MSDTSIDNKNEVRYLSERVTLLELEVKHINSNMVSVTAILDLKLEIGELSAKLVEIVNNRTEDRVQLSRLSRSVEEISTRLEEYLENNAKVIANQEISSNEQSVMKSDISDIKDMIKSLGKDIEGNNIWAQIKTFSDRSKIHKWFVRIVFSTIVMMFLASATFIFGGGLTLPDILDFLKGVIM